jgi:ABC-2 type transport system ATP-binding protein
MAQILVTEGLTRRYGNLTAVDGLTIAVEAGDVFGLLGPNGAGKTTVIKMLTTLLQPTAGRALVAGFDIDHQAANVRRVIGYVPQLLSADGSLTGYENLLVFARLYDIPRHDLEDRVHESLAMMGLADAAGKLVRTYSGGMIRRLEIAQSMLHRPPVLFLDEPTVGLDPLARRTVWEHIERLREQYGTTIFLTTHYMEEADQLCQHIAIMHLGKVAGIGTPAELKAAVAGALAPATPGGADLALATDGSGVGPSGGAGGGVTLDDVFVYYTGLQLEQGGSYRETSRTRRAARRLG